MLDLVNIKQVSEFRYLPVSDKLMETNAILRPS
jgi:hypothetical protein